MKNSFKIDVDSRLSRCVYSASQVRGAVAQSGERLNGIQEVEGSIPFGSTRFYFLHLRRDPSDTFEDPQAPKSDSHSELFGAFRVLGAPQRPCLFSGSI